MRHSIDIEDGEVNDLITSLLAGLAAYGELLRLEDRAKCAEMSGHELYPGMKPIDPFGTNTVVGDFAEALRVADRLRRDIAVLDEAAHESERAEATRYRLIREHIESDDGWSLIRQVQNVPYVEEVIGVGGLDTHLDQIRSEAKVA